MDKPVCWRDGDEHPTPPSALARFSEEFDPRVHCERFAGTVLVEGAPGVSPRTLRIALQGRGLFAINPGQSDSTEWVSSGCYEQMTLELNWKKPLRAVGLAATYSPTGLDADRKKIDGAWNETAELHTWTVVLPTVRIGARLTVTWKIE